MELRVQVKAGARKERVEEADGGLLIFVRERAERGEANMRVRQIAALRYGVPLSRVRIASGHHSSRKLLRIV